MTTRIEVENLGNQEYRVRIVEAGSESIHSVSLSEKDYQRLTNGNTAPEELLRHSFEFLLQREPKESILRKFDLSVIGQYFPEYEREIKSKLAGS